MNQNDKEDLEKMERENRVKPALLCDERQKRLQAELDSIIASRQEDKLLKNFFS